MRDQIAASLEGTQCKYEVSDVTMSIGENYITFFVAIYDGLINSYALATIAQFFTIPTYYNFFLYKDVNDRYRISFYFDIEPNL